MNHPPLPPPPSTPNPPTKMLKECGNCGSQGRWILHHVRIRGINRRLCTSCVLRLHPSSFCPSCFQFYDLSVSPHPSNRFTCSKCSSITHSHCVVNPACPDPQLLSSTTSSSYLCPPCAKPNFSFFDSDSKPRISPKSIDRKTAVVLLCAAKIASASMAKAVIVARADAERKVREAAMARKRAREALEHVGFVVARERARRKEEASVEVSGSGNLGVKEKERNRTLGPTVKAENAFEMPAVSTLNTGSALTQRRESLNGFVRQMSMVKNEAAASMEESARHKNVEVAERLQSNNNIGLLNEKEKNENGEVEHVKNDHIGGTVNTTK
ncbi:uncharacterized protein LOC105436183 [Cucumis sativus]|uniref:PHD-type domain-containing protein n=1 Tax=Cucumis sativus TaxID=3659 RepID=A0A0A0LYS3_CUCSA|nr:uncharacterized protein LOC105436183 [Cucumis sativus]KGN65987.1 hypothetical protein Csa_007541 [Cucumis sativus]